MAAIQRLETTTLNNPDGTAYGVGGASGHRSFSANLDRSGTFRDGHESRVLVSGAGVNHSGTGPSGVGAASQGELPLIHLLSLESLSVGDPRVGRHGELRRAINAASDAPTDDPTLGTVQSKPLGTFGVEDLKRVRASLVENVSRARDRVRHLNEALLKLDRFRNMLQSRKRSRPEVNVHERPISSLPPDRPTAVPHGVKGSATAASIHSSTVDTVAGQKAGDKNKSVIPNKRVRTSMADVRPEGRPSNLSVQRSSGVQERERDTSRPSSSLASPVQDKERMSLGGNEGWDKAKMKGRRSGVKSDASGNVANGVSDGDRDHKLTAQRLSLDSRARPSEGHGFRSGPVHGITSVHKAEISAQLNGSSVRGLSKGDSDNATPMGEKGDRLNLVERERTISKNGVKVSPRQEVHVVNPPLITKSKAARAPRSSSVAGTHSSVHLSRSSPSGETRERPFVVAATIAQVPAGPSNRKRPAPSRSSSLPVAQWGIQRPQKVARVARRMPPVSISIPSLEESNEAAEVGLPSREGSGTVSTPGTRTTTPGASGGSGLAQRVTVSGTQIRARAERLTVSVGLSETEGSDDDGDKPKEKEKKTGSELGEQKMATPSQKMGSVVLQEKKSRFVSKEEGTGGDGVRRQGRSGRGSVTPRAPVLISPPEKVEAKMANAKQLRSSRATVDTKPDRPGRPSMQKDTVDRKPMTRPRRPLGNSLGELSGESDDDREELANAIQLALNASGRHLLARIVAIGNKLIPTSPTSPPPTCVTSTNKYNPDDSPLIVSLWLGLFLLDVYTKDNAREHPTVWAYTTAGTRPKTKDLDEADKVLHIPSCSDQSAKMDLLRSSGTPPLSPNPDMGSKSTCLANGSVESDGGGSAAKLFHHLKDRHEIGRGGRRGVSGGWFDKIFPLSQRLLSAFINEMEVDDSLKPSDEACQNQPSVARQPQDSESPKWPGSLSESECIDIESEDPDGGSDGEMTRWESECWTSGGREGVHGEKIPLSNGHIKRPGMGIVKIDDQGEGDDILADVEAEDKSSWGSGLMLGCSKAEHCRAGRQGYGAAISMTAGEAQYHRMSLDDRLLLELQSVGLLPDQVLSEREDDEISEELRKLQRELKDQVCTNKKRIGSLENVLLARKQAEERARECLAMDKFVGLAYTKRMGPRGGSSGSKASSAKGARAAALAFAKRVVARVRSFEEGQNCIVDPTLRDLLFCIPPKVNKISMGAVGPAENEAGATLVPAEAPASTTTSPLQPAAAVQTEVIDRPGVHPMEGRIKAEIDSLEGQTPLAHSSKHVTAKDEGWPLRAKEREVLLEDVAGPASMRNVNSLGINGLGGIKGKRSERDRDGKGAPGSHSRGGESAAARPSLSNIKGERKTKTKPRLKIPQFLKAVSALVEKHDVERQPSKDRPLAQGSSAQPLLTDKLVATKQNLMAVLPAPGTAKERRNAVDSEGMADLSQLPLPGIEDLGVPDLSKAHEDLGEWLDFEVEDSGLQPSDEFLMGLDVPMDDLSELTMMM